MLKQVIELYELMDSPSVTAECIINLYSKENNNFEYKINKISTDKGETEFLYIKIKGTEGKSNNKTAPTLGIIGSLGGIGARTSRKGFVSDGDGALTALAAGLKILKMNRLGDKLESDVIITTHICPFAPVIEHYPVMFMDCPASDETINEHCVTDEMDAIISIDTTKGNEIINNKGFAISNTVKEGCILSVSRYMTDIMKRTTGKMPYVFPLAQQDITPYGNGISHLNSIMQPCVSTDAPVLGVAITTEVPVAGCDTGATHITDIEQASRFVVEVAKEISHNENLFYEKSEFEAIKKLYGSMKKYQTKGSFKKTSMGVISMGQTGSENKYEDIVSSLEPEFEAIIEGIMDGYSFYDIHREFWPEDDETPFIVSTMDDGTVIKIAEHHACRLIQDKINKLEKHGIKSCIILCTANFPEFEHKGNLLVPGKIVESMLTALGAKKIGIIVPEEGQAGESCEQYGKYNPIIKAASPYGNIEKILEVSREFADENIDVLLTDCMGFTSNMGKIISESSGKSVLVPRNMIINLQKSLL